MPRHAPLIAAALLVCGLALLPGQPPPAPPAGPAWEYRIVYGPDIWAGAAGTDNKDFEKVIARFNEVGADGWEYCGEVRGDSYLFKRPKR